MTSAAVGVTALALLAVAAVVAVEVVSRAAAAVGGEQIWLKDLALQRKDDQMRRLGRGRRPEVVFVGSSATMCAVDPAVLKQQFGIEAYNAAIFRGAMSYLRQWATDFVLPRCAPTVMVLEVWLVTLNDNSAAVENGEQYRQAPYFTSLARWRAVYDLGSWLTCLRVLPLLRQPRRCREVAAGMWGRRTFASRHRPLTIENVVGPHGESIEHDAKLQHRTGPRMHTALEGFVRDFHLGGAQWSALTQLVEHAGSRGIKVLLYEPPSTARLQDEYFPGGRAAWDAAHARLRAMTRTLDATWLDLDLEMTDEQYFADAVHANLAGKQLVSRAVGAAIVHQVAPRPGSLDRAVR